MLLWLVVFAVECCCFLVQHVVGDGYHRHTRFPKNSFAFLKFVTIPTQHCDSANPVVVGVAFREIKSQLVLYSGLLRGVWLRDAGIN